MNPAEITGDDIMSARLVARKMAGRLPSWWRAQVEDLEGEAVLGIVQAARSFDATLGVPWAYWRNQAAYNAVKMLVRRAAWQDERRIFRNAISVKAWIQNPAYDTDWGGMPAPDHDVPVDPQHDERILHQQRLRAVFASVEGIAAGQRRALMSWSTTTCGPGGPSWVPVPGVSKSKAYTDKDRGIAAVKQGLSVRLAA